VTLQFDTYEERVSVREKYTKKIETLTLMRGDPASEKDVKKHSPPVVLFVWGRMTFKGVIETLSQRYTMFLADGTPVRAECSLKMRNVIERRIDEDVAASFSKSMGGGKQYTVQQGDRLDSIAASQLGDSSRWSEIAMANGIDDPLKELSAGTPLTIPSDE
jgi:Contractile injection system tube protein/LysM domain